MIRVTVLHNADFSAVSNAVPDVAELGDEPPSTGRGAGAEADQGYAAGADVENVAEAIAVALDAVPWFRVNRRAVETPRDVADAVHRDRPDVVFNLCESLRQNARYEPIVAGVLERSRVPFTGSSAATLRLCLDKYSANETLRRAGVPVPATVLCAAPNRLPTGLRYPCFVKPSGEDGSVGITAASIVHDEASLRDRIVEVIERHRQPALVQAYCGTRELNIALLGSGDMRVLPPSEIAFDTSGGLAPIVTYASKWDQDSPEYHATPAVDAVLSSALLARVRRTAQTAARALGLRDYARVDMRLDAAGNLWVIDVNPNCDLSPGAGFARAARRGGLSYQELCWSVALGSIHRSAPVGQPPRLFAPGSRRRAIRAPLPLALEAQV